MTTPPDRRPAEPDRDEVDEASEESFPASDPPSWDPTHTGTPAQAPSRDEPRRDDAPRRR